MRVVHIAGKLRSLRMLIPEPMPVVKAALIFWPRDVCYGDGKFRRTRTVDAAGKTAGGIYCACLSGRTANRSRHARPRPYHADFAIGMALLRGQEDDGVGRHSYRPCPFPLSAGRSDPTCANAPITARGSQVRTRLPAGGKWIRTIGPPRLSEQFAPIAYETQLLTETTYARIDDNLGEGDRWFESGSLQRGVRVRT
jgi:hypothetical protein